LFPLHYGLDIFSFLFSFHTIFQYPFTFILIFWLGPIKERPVQLISDVHDKKDFWKLAVKVKDKWTVVKDGKEHLELLIVDEKVMG
jgi:hypothetical protein